MWRLAEDTIGHDDIDALADWLRTYPRLTQGELVREFEAAWSDWLGVAHSVMVSSGTTANMALMMAVEHRLGRKPRVGVSAVTWATNVSPSILLGHDLVVFDVNRATLGIETEQVVPAMDRGEIDVLFVTHLLGFNSLTAEIIDAADRNSVVILEDVCESHGARYGNRKAGTIGLGSSFSFYFGHHMSTIEGGMLSTDDAAFADTLRLIRAHGLARESAEFESYAGANPDLDPRFLFILPGLNFRSSDLNAFLGLRQLALLDGRIASRNRNLELLLDQAPGGIWTEYETAGVSSFALPLIAEGPREAAAVRRVTEALAVESRPIVAGNLTKQPFMRGVPYATQGTAVADHIHRYGLYVGNGHHVDAAMVGELTRRLSEEIAS
jgi:CDP-6-deoxy-D-xylo-4-hexulose-3-dehydrase